MRKHGTDVELVSDVQDGSGSEINSDDGRRLLFSYDSHPEGIPEVRFGYSVADNNVGCSYSSKET